MALLLPVRPPCAFNTIIYSFAALHAMHNHFGIIATMRTTVFGRRSWSWNKSVNELQRSTVGSSSSFCLISIVLPKHSYYRRTVQSFAYVLSFVFEICQYDFKIWGAVWRIASGPLFGCTDRKFDDRNEHFLVNVTPTVKKYSFVNYGICSTLFLEILGTRPKAWTEYWLKQI